MSKIPDNIRKMWEAAAYRREKQGRTEKTTTTTNEKPLPPEALRKIQDRTNLKFDPKLTGDQ